MTTYLSSLMSSDAVDISGFSKFASVHAPMLGDGLGMLFLEKAKSIALSSQGEDADELSESEAAEHQSRIMALFPVLDASKGGSTVFSAELLWGFGLLWNGDAPLTRLHRPLTLLLTPTETLTLIPNP